MKKLLLSLSTITLLTAPLATVVACAAKSDDTTPETPPVGGGDSDDGSGDGGSGDEGTTPDPDGLRPIMNEVQIEDYLQDRSFVILGDSGTGMGSGWLMDESEDNWYIGTNRHVTKALDDGNGQVYISNDWDRMWEDYDIRDYSYTFTDNGLADQVDADSVVNPMNVAELDWLFNDLRNTGNVGEIIYESVDPNNGNGGSTALDYYDFAAIKVPKVGSIIDPSVDPIEVATFDYVKDQYSYYYESRYFFRGYSFASGNYRFGSFFNNTYINSYNRFQSKAWSPSIAYDPPGDEAGYSNWGFDNGPGSSGSAMIDERGYFVANNTFGYSSVYPWNQGNAAGDPSNFHHSGVSGQGFWDTIYPEYIQTLNEATDLHPTWS